MALASARATTSGSLAARPFRPNAQGTSGPHSHAFLQHLVDARIADGDGDDLAAAGCLAQLQRRLDRIEIGFVGLERGVAEINIEPILEQHYLSLSLGHHLLEAHCDLHATTGR